MKLENHPDFEKALLELVIALHPQVHVQHASARSTAVKHAFRQFLAAVAPLRLKVMIAETDVTLKATNDPLALADRLIDAVLSSGASRRDVACLFNQKVGMAAGGDE